MIAPQGTPIVISLDYVGSWRIDLTIHNTCAMPALMLVQFETYCITWVKWLQRAHTVACIIVMLILLFCPLIGLTDYIRIR